jgi:hypothetical protein
MRAVWPYWPIIQGQSRLPQIFAVAEKYSGYMDLRRAPQRQPSSMAIGGGMNLTP